MARVRLAVVGAGTMGEIHLKNAAAMPGVELAAVCDVIPERAERFAAEYKCRAYTSAARLLKSRAADAVLIATPHYSHTTLGIAALKSGHHVLVEKPISVHKADCEKLIAAHEDKQLVFAAMFNQRMDPLYIRLKDLIARGALGRLDRITWIITEWFRTEAYYTSGGWRATWAGEGGGVLLNQCPHNLDLWQWCFGMPARVRAFCKVGRKHKIEVEDEVTALMEYPDGASGILVTSTGEAPGVNRLEVAGEFGTVLLENRKLTFTRNSTSSIEFINTSPERFGRPTTTVETESFDSSGPQHAGVLQNFIEAIAEGKPLVAPAAEGIRSVELGNAMLLSSETGRTLELPLDGRAYQRLLKRKIRESARPRDPLQ
jgi:predicted dehydrogenase